MPSANSGVLRCASLFLHNHCSFMALTVFADYLVNLVDHKLQMWHNGLSIPKLLSMGLHIRKLLCSRYRISMLRSHIKPLDEPYSFSSETSTSLHTVCTARVRSRDETPNDVTSAHYGTKSTSFEHHPHFIPICKLLIFAELSVFDKIATMAGIHFSVLLRPPTRRTEPKGGQGPLRIFCDGSSSGCFSLRPCRSHGEVLSSLGIG